MTRKYSLAFLQTNQEGRTSAAWNRLTAASKQQRKRQATGFQHLKHSICLLSQGLSEGLQHVDSLGAKASWCEFWTWTDRKETTLWLLLSFRQILIWKVGRPVHSSPTDVNAEPTGGTTGPFLRECSNVPAISDKRPLLVLNILEQRMQIIGKSLSIFCMLSIASFP